MNDILKRSGWYAGPIGSLSTDATFGLVVVTVVGLFIAGLVLVVMLLV